MGRDKSYCVIIQKISILLVRETTSIIKITESIHCYCIQQLNVKLSLSIKCLSYIEYVLQNILFEPMRIVSNNIKSYFQVYNVNSNFLHVFAIIKKQTKI